MAAASSLWPPGAPEVAEAEGGDRGPGRTACTVLGMAPVAAVGGIGGRWWTMWCEGGIRCRVAGCGGGAGGGGEGSWAGASS